MFSGKSCRTTIMNPEAESLRETGLGSAPVAAENAARRRIVEARERALAEGGWWGTWTLFVREAKRFLGMAGQTLLSPVLTTMLYFVVFGYTLGSRLDEIRGVPYMDFLVPGLIMLNMINSAYMNSAFSLFLAKVHGSVVDLLVTPLSPLQLIVGYVGASVLRSMLTGGVIWAVAAAMGAHTTYHIGWTLGFMLLTSVAFALIGVVVAILAEDFDHVNFLPSFLVMPLTFLGGVFYSIQMLPDPWSTVSKFNPILYMVNGLRYGMTGVTDVSPVLGLGIMCGLVLVFGWATAKLFSSGRKLRDGR